MTHRPSSVAQASPSIHSYLHAIISSLLVARIATAYEWDRDWEAVKVSFLVACANLRVFSTGKTASAPSAVSARASAARSG